MSQGPAALHGSALGHDLPELVVILLFLDSRGIAVSDRQRDRITSCTDLTQLELWARRAAVVDTAEQLSD